MMTPPDPNRVYTLDDLRNWTRTAPSYAVIGHPVAHSRSPLMHNAALAELSRTQPEFRDRAYFKFDIEPERLAEALPLFREKNFAGLNLTLPHKVDAVALVAGLSPMGRAAGAVNTLVARDDGWFGHNTDGPGFARACEARLGVKLKGADVILLGAGGAARAVAAAAVENGCKTLWIGNRDRVRLNDLIETMERLNEVVKTKVVIHPFSLSAVPSDLPAGALLVNCTSLGLKADDSSPFPAAALKPGMAVYDTVYGAHTTTLVRDALAAGLRAESGLSMLCWQGALALELWTGVRVPVSAMWAAIGGTGPIE